jgi:hypothetical protein
MEHTTAKTKFLAQLEKRLIRYFMDTKQTRSMKRARSEARQLVEGVSVMLDTSSTFLSVQKMLVDKVA